MDDIINFDKNKLKETETKVTQISDLLDKGEKKDDNKEKKEKNITGVLDKESIKEFYDDEDSFKEKAKKVANLIKNAKNVLIIFFYNNF
jgi:hypothetical protein